MAWRKSPTELVELFEASMPDHPEVTRRKMFGYPAAFARGHLFASLFQDQFALRLSPDDCAAFGAQFGECMFAPMPGRVMRNYVTLPDMLLAEAQPRSEWIGRALRNALALPPKAPRARKRS